MLHEHTGDSTLRLNQSIGQGYINNSQKARVVTEAWISLHMYCPACGNKQLAHYEANKPVADFFCRDCRADFELKSKKQVRYRAGKRIAGGAYATMMQRISALNNPHLLFMTHDGSSVTNLCFIPNYFFTPSCIEARKPLSATACRAGWQGCNIRLDLIPEMGKIDIIRDSYPIPMTQVRQQYQHSARLHTANLSHRGWLMDVASCLDAIPSNEFSLKEVYAFEQKLASLHPENKHICPKIRQQLQILRDRGIIEFTSPGKYRKISI